MMKLTALTTLVLAMACESALAQENKEFTAFARQTDSLVQAAYERKDAGACVRYMDDFVARYNKLDFAEKDYYKGNLQGDLYNVACAYSLAGDNAHALDYLERSGYYYYDHLLEDHDMDNLRKEDRFVKFLEKAKRESGQFSGLAFKTPYKANLSDDEKVAGLSLLWSMAKYNFVYFDRVDLDWDKSYMEYISKVKATKSTADYYKVLTKFYTQLKDGHTNVYVPEELSKEFYSRPPIRTELVEGRVIVTKVYSDALKKEGIVPGLEVTRIDGQPARQYADKNVVPYESSSTPQDMAVRAFSYGLLCGPESKPVALELKDSKGKTFVATIARKGYKDLVYPPQFEFRMIGDVAYVAVNNFENPKINKLFDSVFSQIATASGLIIDVRNNGGGSSSIGYNILSRLTDKPFMASAWKRMKYVSMPGARADWEAGSAGEVRPNGKMLYTRPVIVLIGPRTFSAAEDFAVAFDYMKRGKMIGEATGGSTGQPVGFPLPGGGYARVCGKADVYPDGKVFVGTGIVPDIMVRPTLADVQDGRDGALERAIEVLKAGKN